MRTQAAQQQFDIDELRARLSEQLRSSASFSQTVYQEQPILMTGKQLKNFVPEAIGNARHLARQPHLRHASATQVFYEQARALAGYEDDFEYTGTFLHYYPTYEDMNNEQLRGYFSWRAKVRRGQIQRGSLSFAYLYLYELINLVGVKDAQDGYETMRTFGDAYAAYDKHFRTLFETWLDDFVVYYQLDPALLRSMSFAEHDAAYDILLHWQEHADKKLFEAITLLSSYQIIDSPFFLDHEAELMALVAHAYRVVASHHDAKLKNPLITKLFGRAQHERYIPFRNAVFANPLKTQRLDYQISPYDTVFCREGAWYRARYASLETKSPWLSQLLETSESVLRDAYDFPNTLTRRIKTKYIIKSLETKAERLIEDKRAAQARAVHIDFGKLDHIRIAAESTCEKLIVEEEHGVTAAPETSLPSPASNRKESAEVRDNERAEEQSCYTAATTCDEEEHVPAQFRMGNSPVGCFHSNFPPERAHRQWRSHASSGLFEHGTCSSSSFSNTAHELSSLELSLLEALLANTSIREFEQQNHCMASVLIDSINEKLFDEFADICIDEGANGPQIIEDYFDDLKELIAA